MPHEPPLEMALKAIRITLQNGYGTEPKTNALKIILGSSEAPTRGCPECGRALSVFVSQPPVDPAEKCWYCDHGIHLSRCRVAAVVPPKRGQGRDPGVKDKP